MIQQTEFSIKSRKEIFRVGKIDPIDLLTTCSMIDFENAKVTKNLFEFILENVEVKQGETWLPVKTKGRSIYNPAGIEDNLMSFNEIVNYFMKQVIMPVFQKSSE